MYNKQQWLDEIPDLSRPILDGSGKQKTDPQTGRPLFELVQAGTRITSTRLNTMEGGIEGAHVLIEQLAKELAGNFVAVIDGVMGLQCSTQGLTASWTAGVAYVGGRRFEVSAGNMTLNPTQGQYLYVDADGTVKKTTSQAAAKAGVLLLYVATDASGVISSTDQRVNISLEEILMKLENIDVPEATLTEKGIVQLSNATNGKRENVAATEKAVKDAYDRGSTGVTAAATAQSRADSAYSEATAAKQLGVEQKANVVAALNSIGVTASTSESWAQLIPKIAAVIRATGNATAAEILAGKKASNANGLVTGTMPHLTGNRAATGVAKWPDGGLAVYPEKGYQKGGVGDGEIKVSVAQLKTAEPNLVPGNILRGKTIYGTAGELDPAVKGTATLSSSLSRYDVLPLQTRRFPVITIPAGATMLEFQVEDNSATATSLEIYEVTPVNPCLIYLCLKDSAGNEIRLFTLNNYQNSQTYFQHGVINFLTPSLTYVYSNYPTSTEHKIFSFNPIAAVPNFNRNQPMSMEVVAYNYNDTYTAKYSHFIRGKLSYM